MIKQWAPALAFLLGIKIAVISLVMLLGLNDIVLETPASALGTQGAVVGVLLGVALVAWGYSSLRASLKQNNDRGLQDLTIRSSRARVAVSAPTGCPRAGRLNSGVRP